MQAPDPVYARHVASHSRAVLEADLYLPSYFTLRVTRLVDVSVFAKSPYLSRKRLRMRFEKG